MKIKKSKFNNIRFIIIISIFLLIIFSIRMTNSRYISGASSETDLIAKAILTLSNDTLTFTADNLLPGNTKEYDFSVANYDEINTNEVDIAYHLEITEPSGENPLTMELRKLNTGTGSTVAVTNGKTANIDLGYEGKQITNYKLILKWDESKKDSKFAGLNLQYKIKLVAEQKR